jgi:hypothetical protein
VKIGKYNKYLHMSRTAISELLKYREQFGRDEQYYDDLRVVHVDMVDAGNVLLEALAVCGL